MVAQFGHLAIVSDLSITDRAGIAVTYDHRIHQMIQKTDLGRSPNTVCSALLIALSSDVRAAAIRGFDVRAEAIRIDKEKAKTEADKGETKKSKDWDKKCGE